MFHLSKNAFLIKFGSLNSVKHNYLRYHNFSTSLYVEKQGFSCMNQGYIMDDAMDEYPR